MNSGFLFCGYSIFIILFIIRLAHIYRTETVFRNDVLKSQVMSYRKRFLSDNLTSVAPPEDVIPSNIVQNPIYEVAPKQRLSSCLIPKNMSTVLASIFCFLVDPQKWMERNISLTKNDERFCSSKNELYQLRQIESLSKGLPWSNIVFVREPGERFISGYMYLCRSSNCFDCGVRGEATCVLEGLFRELRLYSERRSNEVSTHLWHLGPQNWHCNFEKNMNKFEIIQYSTSRQEKMVENLSRVLRDSGLSEERVSYLKRDLTSGETSHTTFRNEHTDRLRTEIKENRRIKELLHKIFYWDYVLFGFPLPNIE